jgi:uncharacterized protein
MEFSPALVAAMVAAFVGGFNRGFTGFGGALIFIPVASAAVGPQLAAPIFLVMDFVLTLPMVARALRICRWSTVLPAAIAGAITTPVGAWLLAVGDPLVLRWSICVLVILLLVLIMSGWRYRGAPKIAASAGVGGVAGIFGGIAQVSGPAVIAFWMSGTDPVKIIRANMFVFFGCLAFSTFAAYFWNGFYTSDGLRLILLLAPIYAAALFLGGKIFARTKGANYRPLAYALVAFSALSSMPLFDGILR